MRTAPDRRRRRVTRSLALTVLLALGRTDGAPGSPLEYLPVGDPLEAELRVLEVLGPGPGDPPFALPRLGARPLQRGQLDSLVWSSEATDPARRISLVRLRRVLGREADRGTPRAGGPGLTPRLYQRHHADGSRSELSFGAEGGGTLSADRWRYASDTGLHGRLGLETDRWLAFSHLVAGHQDTARAFADPLFARTDLIVFSRESYLGYTGAAGRWSVQFGRNRWHWGPGDEGSLILSRTSVPLTGLVFHARLDPLRADGTALSATLRSGEQLAAHRLEWQPREGLRLGLTEAARYRAPAWQPLYLVGVIPYILVQRIQDQDEPQARAENRNNILIGADLAWRVAPGTRLYGEWLADDLHVVRSVAQPSKYAYQLGWEGAGTVRGTRLVWGGEFTRLTRYVYTSHFGRDFVAQGRPLGFPVAPDARRMRVRLGWDLSPAWQLSGGASRTEKGENRLSEPFVPGSPGGDASRLQGVVEERREVEAGLRWWPTGGVEAGVGVGYRWVDEAGHVPGARERGAHGVLSLRLVR